MGNAGINVDGQIGRVTVRLVGVIGRVVGRGRGRSRGRDDNWLSVLMVKSGLQLSG